MPHPTIDSFNHYLSDREGVYQHPDTLFQKYMLRIGNTSAASSGTAYIVEIGGPVRSMNLAFYWALEAKPWDIAALQERLKGVHSL